MQVSYKGHTKTLSISNSPKQLCPLMHREENRQPPKHAVDPPPSRGLHRRNSTYGARYAKSSHHPSRQQHNMSNKKHSDELRSSQQQLHRQKSDRAVSSFPDADGGMYNSSRRIEPPPFSKLGVKRSTSKPKVKPIKKSEKQRDYDDESHITVASNNSLLAMARRLDAASIISDTNCN